MTITIENYASAFILLCYFVVLLHFFACLIIYGKVIKFRP